MPAVPRATTTAIVVTLDASRRVSGVTINGLPDDLRTPDGLSAALWQAYLRAVTARSDGRRDTPGAGDASHTPRPAGARPVAVATRTPPRARSEAFGHVDPAELTEFWRTATPEPAPPGRRGVGASANGCVRVRLHSSDHFADLDLDPGWLRGARAGSVAAAVLEAFEDAYAPYSSCSERSHR